MLFLCLLLTHLTYSSNKRLFLLRIIYLQYKWQPLIYISMYLRLCTFLLSFFIGWDPLLCRCYQERRQKCHPRNRILNKAPCRTWYTNTFEISRSKFWLDVSNLEYIWYTFAKSMLKWNEVKVRVLLKPNFP